MRIAFEIWDVSNIKEIYIETFYSEEEAIETLITRYEAGRYTIRKVYIKE